MEWYWKSAADSLEISLTSVWDIHQTQNSNLFVMIAKKKKSVNVWKSKEIVSMCLRLDQWLNYSCFWGKTRLPEHLDTQESGIFHKCFNLLYLFYAISAWNTNWITDQKSSKHILLFFQDSPGLTWCLIPSVCCWIRRETGQYVVVFLVVFSLSVCLGMFV